jgi:hypothetical protein
MIVYPSGALTVPQAAQMLTAQGRKQLTDMRALRDFVRSQNRCAGEIVNPHVLPYAAQASRVG